jgi:1-deoxy-D-xylulose 5-phosphate reductoisomerase
MMNDNDFLYFDPVTIATILGAVGTAGVQAVDASKRRKIEAGLATLNAQEQKELQEKTLKAQTQQAKLQLIEDSIAKKRREKYIPYYIGGGLLVVGIIGAIVYFKKK